VQRFTDEDVKVRAYYIWEKKGKPEQDRQAQQEDYFRARKELTQEERAYYIWEKKGKPQQDRQAQQEDYFRARRELEAEKLVDDDKDLNQGVAAEIKASVRAPELINQAQFNFCGPNDLLMAIALKDPVAYVKYVLDVHAAEREFQAGLLSQGRTAKLGQMSVAMDPSVLGAQAAGFYREFVTDPSISQTDWMSMASLRKQATATAPAPIVTQDVQDILDAFQGPGGASAALGAMKSPADLETAIMWLKQEFERTPGQTLEGMAVAPASQQKAIEILRKIAEGTSSDEVAQWMTKYGATDITNTAKYDRGRTTQDLQSANTDLAAGKSVMLQIDARGAQGDHLSVTFNPTKGHWVLMKTPFTFSAPIWSCEVYTWGAVHTLKIVERRIKDAYYGRVSATIAAP
jgi:hypothetical protein